MVTKESFGHTSWAESIQLNKGSYLLGRGVQLL
jgi:hypothetical protein